MKVLLVVLTLFSLSWCDELPTIEKFFHKIGQYEFHNENNQSIVKSYYASRAMAVSWINAFERCKAFDMDLVELPTAAESDLFLTLCTEQQIPLKELDFHVGGSYHGVGLNEFYWMTTGKRVNYTLKWGSGEPNSPNKETCLAITKNKGIFLFNDIDCILSPCNFICQRNTIKKSESVVDPADSKIPSIVTQCKPASIEWLPHPISCDKYIFCFHGTPIEKNCASNLRFSAKKGKCISSELPCCPQVDDVKNPVFLSNINDCSKYYVCFSGNAIERSCDKGLFYDVTSNSCTYPENLICGSRPIIAPTMEETLPIDTSICRWHGNVIRGSGSYIKSLCYYDKQTTHQGASDICHTHGMRLLRIEDNTVQTATFAYLLDMFGKGNNGVYYISGTNIEGSWYHDENTSVNDNMQWKDGKRPESGCLALCAHIPFSIDAFSCTQNLPAICEFNKQSESNN